MIQEIARTLSPAGSDVRGAYRQRMLETLGSGRTSGGSQEPLREPVALALRVAAHADLDLPELVRTDQSTPQPAPRQPSPRREAITPDPPSAIDQVPADASDALGQAAERVARNLTEGLASIMNNQERRRSADAVKLEAVVVDMEKAREERGELRDSLCAQQRLIEGQVLAAISRIDARLDALHRMLQSQAEDIAGLGSANDGLSRNQQAVQQRLDHQADVNRELTSAVTAQQDRWSQYRSALEKLKEITDSSSLPAGLPDNL